MIDKAASEKIVEEALNKMMEKHSKGRLNWEAAKALIRQFNSQLKSESQFNIEMTNMLLDIAKTAIVLTSEFYENNTKELRLKAEELERAKKANKGLMQALLEKDQVIASLREGNSKQAARYEELNKLIEKIKKDDWIDWIIYAKNSYSEFFLGYEIKKIDRLELTLENASKLK